MKCKIEIVHIFVTKSYDIGMVKVRFYEKTALQGEKIHELLHIMFYEFSDINKISY